MKGDGSKDDSRAGGISALSTRCLRRTSSNVPLYRCIELRSLVKRIADSENASGGILSSVNVQAREYRFKILFVRSGNRPVRVRRFAERSAGSSDFLPLMSGKLFEGAWLDDFEEPAVVLSKFGKIISGI